MMLPEKQKNFLLRYWQKIKSRDPVELITIFAAAVILGCILATIYKP